MVKYVYSFGGGEADGNDKMKDLLGGKGALLADMSGHPNLRLPVPAGFTITTEVCTCYYKNSKNYPSGLKEEVQKALEKVEKTMGRKFGDPANPLLVSVRSGARHSMPGMMETVLNVGLTSKTIPGLAKHTNNERFVYDSYRRLIMMYADIVMEKAAGIEPADDMGIRKQLERIMEQAKHGKGAKNDTELNADDLKKLCDTFKKKVREVLKKDFPDDHNEQLWGAISAVFQSWNGKRAIAYRKIEKIPDEWGTAVNVQSMVFGNLNDNSATGVAFTRNPATCENFFYGEYLINAQGEDVVAGTRTPAPINKESQSDHNKHLKTLEQEMPEAYKQLVDIKNKLEKHSRDMLDIEFTIENGKLFMLQYRVGKRNGPAAVRIAHEMFAEKLITDKEAVMRVTPEQLDELLHPILDPKAEIKTTPVAKGLPAGPGGGVGEIVLTPSEAVKLAKEGKSIILVREETNPEDIEGMRAAKAILTARGGMTSHAALVARGWGKCCIVGCGEIKINHGKKEIHIGEKIYKEGDFISLKGSKGLVYDGKMPMMSGAEENKMLSEFLRLCDKVRKLGVRANAETPQDAKKALAFGAEGIGLFRTEHMFYGEGAEKPLFILRKMIASKTGQERKKALDELFPFVKDFIKNTMEVMGDMPVTIRLLDPPLHEFVPNEPKQREVLANSLGITLEELNKRAENLHESNPMMGHRGVRLGVTYPEISEMQFRAILESAAELVKSGRKSHPEIMIHVVADIKEIQNQKELCDRVYSETIKKFGIPKIDYSFGTMIEIPRAALLADRLAEASEFFSFGTNDLTQMGFGFSRDDIGAFLPDYLNKNILPKDPFQAIDQDGIGQLIKIGIERGRSKKQNLKVGICGEHGGEPSSIEFCHRVGMNYVSCSPFRVPIARLAAAQAAVVNEKK